MFKRIEDISFRFGRKSSEERGPKLKETRSLEEFARLVAKHPNPADRLGERLLAQRKLPYVEGAPFLHITARPTGFGSGLEFVYRPE